MTRNTMKPWGMLLVLLAVFAVPAAAQQQNENANDLAFLRDAAVPTDTAQPQSESLLPDDNVSDPAIVAHVAIRLYQTFISSQHHNVCVFTPSCSHFGIESLHECGFAKGFLLTADRLTRCNSMAGAGGYGSNRATGRYGDPVWKYCSDTTGLSSIMCPRCRVVPR